MSTITPAMSLDIDDFRNRMPKLPKLEQAFVVGHKVALYRVIAEREFRLFRNYGGAMGWNCDDLRGHDLACWCPLDKPCHADVLLELANR